MTEKHEVFTTSDIGISAYLQLLGYKLVVCKRLESGKFHFEFHDPNSECRLKSLETSKKFFFHRSINNEYFRKIERFG